MRIDNIISERGHDKRPSFDLVYEWEDEISNALNLNFFLTTGKERKFQGLPFISNLFLPSKCSFMFHLTTYMRWYSHKRNIIPCIIDFYCRDSFKMRIFNWLYKSHPLVLISSREAFEYLKSMKCPLRLAHFPLSIADKYRITSETKYYKKYDLVIMGRPNPVLVDYVKEYATLHPSFYYVYRVKEENGKLSYYSNKGESLGNINSREKYMELMSQSKVGLYAVPGIDGDESQTNGFHQVTPRFFELLVNGCHVIARYIDNPDTDYFELRSICPHTEDYQSFEEQMDYALTHQVDLKHYASYLEKHYTSKRAKMLEELVQSL